MSRWNILARFYRITTGCPANFTLVGKHTRFTGTWRVVRAHAMQATPSTGARHHATAHLTTGR